MHRLYNELANCFLLKTESTRAKYYCMFELRQRKSIKHPFLFCSDCFSFEETFKVTDLERCPAFLLKCKWCIQSLA